MKIRTDLTGLAFTGLCVVAIVVLTIAGHDVPELLSTLALGALTFSGGAAIPTTLGGSTAAAPAPAEPVAQVPDVAPAPLVAVEPAPLPAPRPAPVPGRDWTEQIPRITPEMIAADKAGQA